MGLWIFAALISAFIKGLCGVGDAPVFSSILAFRHDNIDISPVSLLLSIPANFFMTWRNRKALKRSVWLPLALLLECGSIPGTLLLKNSDTRVLKLAFGIFIIIVGILMLMNELSTEKRRASRLLLIVVGILSGISSGLFGIGVLLIVYMSQTTENMQEFKGNICMVFAIDNVVRLILYSAIGIIRSAHVKQALLILPFVLIGMFIGIKSADYLDERKAKIVVMIMLIVSGVALVGANI